MRWLVLDDFPCSIVPIVALQMRRRMSQRVDLHAICTVRPAHMETVQSLAAPWRTLHIVGKPALVVAGIAALRYLDCIALGSAVHHTARLVRSHRLVVHRLAPFQRVRRHSAIPADT
jgi:hypothetical protein